MGRIAEDSGALKMPVLGAPKVQRELRGRLKQVVSRENTGRVKYHQQDGHTFGKVFHKN